jgi:hypothetical protein
MRPPEEMSFDFWRGYDLRTASREELEKITRFLVEKEYKRSYEAFLSSQAQINSLLGDCDRELLKLRSRRRFPLRLNWLNLLIITLFVLISLLTSCKKEEEIKPLDQHVSAGFYSVKVLGSAGTPYSFKIWAIGFDNKIFADTIRGGQNYALSLLMAPQGFYGIYYRDTAGVERSIVHTAPASGWVLITDTIPATIY